MQNDPSGIRCWFFGYTSEADCLSIMLQEAWDRSIGGERVAYFAAQDPPARSMRYLPRFERVQDICPQNLQEMNVRVLIVFDAAQFYNEVGAEQLQRLLSSGVDVYGTLYLSQIFGVQEHVASISEDETKKLHVVPDSVFDEAEEIRFVERESHITDTRAQTARFSVLRETALRRMAERVDRRQWEPRGETGETEHILVCVSPSPSNAHVLRSAAKLARSMGARLTALYVETQMHIGQMMRYRLQENLSYARMLGASVVNVYGADIPLQVAEYAKIARVTKIMLGRTYSISHAAGMTHRLLEYAPDIDVFIVPDENAVPHPIRDKRWFSKPDVHISDLLFCFVLLLLCTLISFVMWRMHLSMMNIAAVYVLGIVAVSWRVSHPLAVFAAAPVYYLMHAFFDIPTGRPESLAIATILGGTALITGAVMDRSNRIAGASAKNAYNTSVLLSAGQNMYAAQSMQQIGRAAMHSVQNLLGCAMLFCYREQNGEYVFMSMDAEGRSIDEKNLGYNELAAARYAFEHNETAGRGTAEFRFVKARHVPLADEEGVNAVIGIFSDMQISNTDDSLLDSLLMQISFALEKYQADRKREQASVAAENEMMRANLLRAISHDLRTPLTGIMGSANLLMTPLEEDVKLRLAQDICQDAQWLVNLVENVLSVTRIEDGRLNLNLSPQIVEEIVDEALTHVTAHAKDALIREDEEGFLLIRADAQLLTQVVVNLVNNAFHHGGDNVHVWVRTYMDGSDAVIEVEDDGAGVPDAAKEKIFELFYTAQEGGAGDRRKGLGVGLALCKSIIHAHNGTIILSDAQPHGAKFTIRLAAIELQGQEEILQ